MNRKLLETFLWAARMGSFRAAADHLNSTQPAVSMRIRELERGLGIKLFERGIRASRLTIKGEELLPYAERILGLMQEMQHHVADPRNAEETIRVGVAELVAVTWLPKLVAQIGEKFPNVSLRLDVDLTRGLAHKLRNRELDVILCDGPVIEANIENISLGAIDVAWFASPAVGLPDKLYQAKDLSQIAIISVSEDSLFHARAIEWLHNHGRDPYRINFCNTIHTVSILVRSGQGVSVLPTEYCRFYMRVGEMQLLKSEPPLSAIEYVAAYDRARASPMVIAIASITADMSPYRLSS